MSVLSFLKLRQTKSWDSIIPARITITEPHWIVHQGRMFLAQYENGALGNDGTLDILISTGDATVHLQGVEIAVGGGPDRLQIYEGVTTSNDGTGLTVLNKNRRSSNTPDAALYHTPTVTDLGTELDDIVFITAGRRAGAVSVVGRGEEWVLQPNTKYLIRLTNQSGGVQQAQLHVLFYEPDTSILS